MPAPLPTTEDTSLTPSKSEGLCASCQARSSCCLYSAGSPPLVYCNEFEAEPGAPPSSASLDAMARLSIAPEPAPPERSLGLCLTCAHRQDCTFDAPAGGVWHCEEYH